MQIHSKITCPYRYLDNILILFPLWLLTGSNICPLLKFSMNSESSHWIPGSLFQRVSLVFCYFFPNSNALCWEQTHCCIFFFTNSDKWKNNMDRKTAYNSPDFQEAVSNIKCSISIFISHFVFSAYLWVCGLDFGLLCVEPCFILTQMNYILAVFPKFHTPHS